MNEWENATVGDFFELITGYAFKSKEFRYSGVPVIKIKNVKANEFSKHKFSYVDARYLSERNDKVAQKDDLLISMSGNRHDGSLETWVGKVCRFNEDEPYLINQRVGSLRLKKNKPADLRFFGFLLSGIPYQERFISIATSSGGQSNLSPSQILGAPVRYPDVMNQCRIGQLLGTLDDKIELNRRMNETLESMARAIFKDWFVDFGPTRAKAEGRDPYLAPEIWDLFPDRLDEEDKPVGWKECPLKDFFQIIGGGTPKTSVTEYWGGSIPWFSVVDTPERGSVFVIDTEKNITERGLNKSSTRLISPGTTIISARGTVGNLAMAASEMTFNQSCYALRRTDETGDYFVYLAAQQMVEQLQVMAHGSVFSTITRQTFEAITLAMPSPATLEEFEQQVSPLFQRIRANVFESRTLSQTRDLLLPKLMSGEIRIKDIENLASEAA